jgi:hypothetical protein
VRTIAADDLVRSPAWFPVERLEGKLMRLVRLDEAAYRAASFLDQRLLVAGHEQGSCALAVLANAARQLAPPAGYILHTGHVGSTLISRLVGEHAGLFSLREPALLRVIALRPTAAGEPESLEVTLALLGRTWRGDQRAIVKATSFVSELADRLLAAAHRPVAILMYSGPDTYLRTILAGANSRAETAQLVATRLARLTRRLGTLESLVPRSEGECVAMSWLCEMSALQQAADRFPAQISWLDFDEFLADPRTGLRETFRALGATPAAQEIESLVSGTLMRRYSKAPEHPYDAALRDEVLRLAEREHGAEIRRGMQWLLRLAARFPGVQRVLDGPQQH